MKRLLIVFYLITIGFLQQINAEAPNTENDSGTEQLMDAYLGLGEDELLSNQWDMTGRLMLGQASGVLYLNTDVYIETVGERSDYYKIKNDSVYWTGYSVGRRLGLLLTDPLLLSSGRQLENEGKQPYYAEGKFDVRFPLLSSGETELTMVKEGRLIINPGDTLTHVRLTKQTDYSIVRLEMTEDIDTLTRTVYRWYKKDADKPIAIQDGEKLYIPSQVNHELYTEEKEEITPDIISNLIESAEVQAEGNTITVTLSANVSVKVYIMDVSGNIYGFTEGNTDHYSINTKGLSHGNYLISIVSTETEYCRKEYIKL